MLLSWILFYLSLRTRTSPSAVHSHFESKRSMACLVAQQFVRLSHDNSRSRHNFRRNVARMSHHNFWRPTCLHSLRISAVSLLIELKIHTHYKYIGNFSIQAYESALHSYPLEIYTIERLIDDPSFRNTQHRTLKIDLSFARKVLVRFVHTSARDVTTVKDCSMTPFLFKRTHCTEHACRLLQEEKEVKEPHLPLCPLCHISREGGSTRSQNSSVTALHPQDSNDVEHV